MEQSPKQQEKGLLGSNSLEKIALVRSLAGLGDILCTVPTFRALRVAFPQAEIVLIGLASVQPLVKRFNRYIDKLIEFPGYPGLPEQPIQLSKIPAFIQNVQQQQFDLAIQMHGNGIITNPLTALLGARWNAGFFLPGQYCPDESRFLPYVEHESEVLRYLRLLEFLEVPSIGTDLEFPLYEEDWQALQAIDKIKQLAKGEYICVHPGASTSDRRWQPEQFATVADAIAPFGLQVVLTGSIAEVELTQTVASMMQSPSINLAGHTNLGAMAALLQDACLLICNDTGVSHMAAALHLKSVVIFTKSDPQRWAPLNRDRHRAVYSATNVSPETVIAQAKELIQEI